MVAANYVYTTQRNNKMMDVREFQNIFPEFQIEKEKNIINWETYAYAFTLKLSP